MPKSHNYLDICKSQCYNFIMSQPLKMITSKGVCLVAAQICNEFFEKWNIRIANDDSDWLLYSAQPFSDPFSDAVAAIKNLDPVSSNDA